MLPPGTRRNTGQADPGKLFPPEAMTFELGHWSPYSQVKNGDCPIMCLGPIASPMPRQRIQIKREGKCRHLTMTTGPVIDTFRGNFGCVEFKKTVAAVPWRGGS